MRVQASALQCRTNAGKEKQAQRKEQRNDHNFQRITTILHEASRMRWRLQ
ncbi:Hypothetical protein SMAX5B_016936 [Scophthalmus maximus]|uniref:Uncharacterized protein n=1 Tax=Scophthalmus maximus TaxID=52904 RepID=A0A2U9CQB3_SCOMX|nr:Hypothetical protein SMAX5B_016936 [Scophthalmus maximus]